MHIIAGIHKNRPIKSPKGSLTRPTSGRLRETVFNICQGYIQGSHFLDLFAGSGAMGLEALSRGAASCVFVDNSRESIQCIKANLQSLNFDDKARVIFGDIFTVLKGLINSAESFDLIYADPPYEKKGRVEGEIFSYSGKLLEIIDQSSLLAPEGVLFIEDARTFVPEVEMLKRLSFVSVRSAGITRLHQLKVKQ